MRPDTISSLADFFTIEGGVSGLGRGNVIPAVGLGTLFAIKLLLHFINFFKRSSLSWAVALRKFSPEKRMGAHISISRS